MAVTAWPRIFDGSASLLPCCQHDGMMGHYMMYASSVCLETNICKISVSKERIR